jgi:hypothetical protein
MTHELMFKRLVDNALDFLSKAVDDLEQYPKYSMIHFHTSVELFVKARLMAEHWTLVVSKRQEPDWAKFVAGDFQSVTLDEAANRLEKVVNSGFSKKELEVFREVTKHRNKTVHFFHEAHTDEEAKELRREIVKQQLTAWYFLHRLLTERWKKTFSGWAVQIVEIDQKLRTLHEFLEVVFENLSDEIAAIKAKGVVFRDCPSCGFESQTHEDVQNSIYNSECLVCGLSQRSLQVECPDCGKLVFFANEGFSKCDNSEKRFEPEHVADILIDDSAAHIAAMDGDDHGTQETVVTVMDIIRWSAQKTTNIYAQVVLVCSSRCNGVTGAMSLIQAIWKIAIGQGVTTAMVKQGGTKMTDVRMWHNKAVNSDAFFSRYAHYKCTGYGWRLAIRNRT